MIQKPILPDCKRRSTPCVFVSLRIFGRISGTVSLIRVNSLSFKKMVLGKNNRYMAILSFFAIDYLVTYSANIRLGASKPGVRTYS